MTERAFIKALCICAIIATVAYAQKTEKPLAEKLDSYITRACHFGFSGAVLVVKDGDEILHKEYGAADSADGAPIHYLGSVSKSFTSAAVMLLQKQGKLKVSDSIAKYLPDVPEDKKGITLHNLLTHSSGLIRSYGTYAGEISREEALKGILAEPLEYGIGERHAYSNAGYNVLVAVVEHVSGKTFEQFMQDELFAPVGMTDTGFLWQTDRWSGRSVDHGYNLTHDYGTPLTWPQAWKRVGAGGMLSTLGDLAKWETALSGDAILSATEKQSMFTAHSKIEEGLDYGYGWEITKTDRGTRLVRHYGDAVPYGHTAAYLRYLDEGVTVIILSNRMIDSWGLVYPIDKGIDAILFDGEKRTILEPGDNVQPAADISGVYEISPGTGFVVKRAVGYLWIGAWGQEAVDVLLRADEECRALHADYNSRTIANFKEMLEGGELQGDIDSLGPYIKYELLGTETQVSPNTPTSYLRIIYENGEKTYRWIWDGGEHWPIFEVVEYPAFMPVVNLGDGTFAAANLFMSSAIRFSLIEHEGKPAISLNGENTDNPVIAVKIK